MTDTQKLMVQLARASLFDPDCDFSAFHDFGKWEELYRLCSINSIGGIVFDCVSKNFADVIPPAILGSWKSSSVMLSAVQLARSEAFFGVYSRLCQSGLHPVILKGEAIRALYPDHYARSSVDEDLYIAPDEYQPLAESLASLGFELVDGDGSDKHWVNKKLSLYLEIHTSLFPDDDIYCGWNEAVDPSPYKTVINKKELFTLSREDGFVFLILHTAKHFVYSGFGIRHLADIALYLNHYQNGMDFDSVKSKLCKARAAEFADDIIALINEIFCINSPFILQKAKVNSTLMADILDSGTLGAGSEERRLSASVTSSRFKNKSALSFLKQVLFPSAKRLKEKYPFAKKYPFLLPAAWFLRILGYLKSGLGFAPVKKANKRMKLLNKYGFIKNQTAHRN